ncbi:biotin holocarboxylase synthetase [Marasmius sp. AFHP31]|nr:biotin holocarboxylase synthetase [Marasmius sp. AFHP31]
MNVLIYSGPEAIPASLKFTLSSIQKSLRSSYSVQPVTPQTLKTQPWSSSCALVVFPECRNINAFQWISSLDTYLANGGSVLCLSSGAIKQSRSSSINRPEISSNSLRFFNKDSGDTLYPTYNDEEGGEIRVTNIQIAGGPVIEGILQSGIRKFDGVQEGNGARILASYTEENVIAAVEFTVGTGKVAFWSPSLEYPFTEEPALSSVPQADANEAERKRSLALQTALTEAGICSSPIPNDTIPRPLPQFLISTRTGTVATVLESIGQAKVGAQSSLFEDANDTFQFHELVEAGELVNGAKAASSISPDPATWQPKRIIVCPDSAIPDSSLTPLFDIALYFRALAEARGKAGCQDDENTWGFGEVLTYGEAVTSTQTMLDKNPRLLSGLPVPYLSIASHQIAGRGRGANSWVSPAGCLQFSLLLRVPLSSFPANKLVFIQYLTALAIAEACREDTVLGDLGSAVRIKWPNDMYAVSGAEKKKIGGILVSTSFSDGKVDIVIGCGVNILNPAPIFSLSQLQAQSNNPLSMERTMAAIMARFEKMWGVFVAGRGDFTPFMDLYLDRWLHSDQLVQLTTVSPPAQARICGITPDHGLLRTLPERTGWSTSHEGFIDLQPDGNSFDLMAGLIKSKS